MMLGPLSRVMMVKQPFCAKNMQNSHFLCATISHARAVPYFQLTWALEWSNQTAQQFNTTAGVQKLCHLRCSETIALQVFRNCGTACWFTEPCGAIVSEHNTARFRCKYRAARAGLNFAHKKGEVCMFSAQNGCLTIITLLRGPKIIIWSHVFCQVHHPFKAMIFFSVFLLNYFHSSWFFLVKKNLNLFFILKTGSKLFWITSKD